MYIYEIFKRDYNELHTLSTDILLGKTVPLLNRHTHKALMLDNNYYARSQLMKKERRKKKQESGLDDTSLYYYPGLYLL